MRQTQPTRQPLGEKMKVIIIHRKGIFDTRGGEHDQVRNTKQAMAEFGVDVTLTDSLPGDYASYDLIHFFGLDACHIDSIQAAKGIPKLLSTVFWDRAQCQLIDHYYEHWPRPGSEFRDNLSYWVRDRILRDRRVARLYKFNHLTTIRRYAEFQKVINDIDLFLPNSAAEMTAVCNFLVVDNPQFRVIPNAVNLKEVDNPSDFAATNLPRDTPFVLCSASITPRKNQYSLVKAMLDIDVPLVLAGAAPDSDYTEVVRRVAQQKKEVLILGCLNSPDLHSTYQAAGVHALPSMHDTPGIANLEAVAHECRNVSTQIGGLREYLGPHSLYCNPFSVEHIRQQILVALDQPPNTEGAKLVRSKFTYEHVIKATYEAYQAVLEAH
jgi:glycosyltransferase involved in cell wall biosynthesis